MTAKQKIGMALVYAGISQAELARRLEMSPQQLNQKINRGKLKLEDWELIGKAIGAKSAEVVFEFEDGKRI